MQQWANFIATNRTPCPAWPDARYRSLAQGRGAADRSSPETFRQVLVEAGSGRRAGLLLIQIGFELEEDAAKLAQSLSAKKAEPYAAYGSVFEFDLCCFTQFRDGSGRPQGPPPARQQGASRPQSRIPAINRYVYCKRSRRRSSKHTTSNPTCTDMWASVGVVLAARETILAASDR